MVFQKLPFLRAKTWLKGMDFLKNKWMWFFFCEGINWGIYKKSLLRSNSCCVRQINQCRSPRALLGDSFFLYALQVLLQFRAKERKRLKLEADSLKTGTGPPPPSLSVERSVNNHNKKASAPAIVEHHQAWVFTAFLPHYSAMRSRKVKMQIKESCRFLFKNNFPHTH